ncbi:MAG TPA: hypothetical protein VL326_24745 [Kofleriaceae bacterium]|nr:hypothetical protein [Kofleriaceae bacterium]
MALLLVLWPALAVADDNKAPQGQEAPQQPEISKNPSVNEHFHTGVEAYKNHDYRSAAREFETAYKIEPIPTLLFTWAQSERLLGHCDKALPLYNKYLYSDINEKQTAAARDAIKLCPQPVKDEPPPPVPHEGPVWYKDKLGGALTAAGVIGVGFGVVFFVKAAGTRSDANSEMFLDDFKRGLDDATTQRRIGAVSLTVGLALVASGVAVYVIHSKRDTKLVAGTDGHTVFVGARF